MKALIPSKVAEIIFALILIAFAYGHFTNADAMANEWKLVPDYMPGDQIIWIYITSAGLALAAIAIITGILKTLACYLLAAMFLVIVFTIHLKPAMDGNMGNLLKYTAMAMCAILVGNRNAKN